MLRELSEHWWAFVLRGIFAVIFAFAAFTWPGLTLIVLIFFFGIYALVDGVTAIVMGIGNKKWYWYVLSGVVGILAGIFALTRPGITGLALLTVIGVWALVKGVTEIVAAIQLRKVLEREWLLALGGLASVVFGLFVLARPGAGALAVVGLIALYALFFGTALIFLGIRLRRLKAALEAAPPESPAAEWTEPERPEPQAGA
jgi:uncharacterized membrane protein HdeD (DUF308 family)